MIVKFKNGESVEADSVAYTPTTLVYTVDGQDTEVPTKDVRVVKG